jgi:hypothetical protein
LAMARSNSARSITGEIPSRAATVESNAFLTRQRLVELAHLLEFYRNFYGNALNAGFWIFRAGEKKQVINHPVQPLRLLKTGTKHIPVLFR